MIEYDSFDKFFIKLVHFILLITSVWMLCYCFFNVCNHVSNVSVGYLVVMSILCAFSSSNVLFLLK